MSENPVSPNPPPPLAPAPSEAQARTWNMWCHMSALCFLIGVPFGNILGPLLVWQVKKNEFPSVAEHAKAALNFQITVLIAVVCTIMAAIVLTLVFIGVFLLPVAGLIGLAGVVCAVIAGIKANDGKPYTYPYSFNFIK